MLSRGWWNKFVILIISIIDFRELSSFLADIFLNQALIKLYWKGQSDTELRYAVPWCICNFQEK